MEIVRRNEYSARRDNGASLVLYYVFEEYELHYNEMAPGTEQQWHRHEVIEEVIYVISGDFDVQWMHQEKLLSETVSAGDIIRAKDTFHTLVNHTGVPARFLVARMVPDGTDKRETLRSDKHLDPPAAKE